MFIIDIKRFTKLIYENNLKWNNILEELSVTHVPEHVLPMSPVYTEKSTQPTDKNPVTCLFSIKLNIGKIFKVTILCP